MIISRRLIEFFIFLIVILLGNLFVLDYFHFFQREKSSDISPLLVFPSPSIPTPFAIPTVSDFDNEKCPSSCLSLIREATKQATNKELIPTPKKETSLLTKEIYIPLGSGSTKSMDWVEIPGAEAVIDSANYPNVKSIIFEAFLRIPTGNGRVYAKIFDVTEKHDVWFSEVWVEGSETQRVESANINFSSGRHLYRVNMKSTMGYDAILDFARIKILLK